LFVGAKAPSFDSTNLMRTGMSTSTEKAGTSPRGPSPRFHAWRKTAGLVLVIVADAVQFAIFDIHELLGHSFILF